MSTSMWPLMRASTGSCCRSGASAKHGTGERNDPLHRRRALAGDRLLPHNTHDSIRGDNRRHQEPPTMKIGMNLLLEATHITPQQFHLLAKAKKVGFDGVEIPLFEGDAAHFKTLRKELDHHSLGAT